MTPTLARGVDTDVDTFGALEEWVDDMAEYAVEDAQLSLDTEHLDDRVEDEARYYADKSLEDADLPRYAELYQLLSANVMDDHGEVALMEAEQCRGPDKSMRCFVRVCIRRMIQTEINHLLTGRY